MLFKKVLESGTKAYVANKQQQALDDDTLTFAHHLNEYGLSEVAYAKSPESMYGIKALHGIVWYCMVFAYIGVSSLRH